ncbi:MAG: protein kinase, partial [Holophagales bacterium]|nr:protein kinase [Holophagales bacterium]
MPAGAEPGGLDPAGPETPGEGAYLPRRWVGRVRLEARIGQGGIGEVYQGWDDSLERRVAVKSLSPRFARDSAACARFLREARMLSKLNHPGICQVYDLIEERGGHFLILELIEGSTLRQLQGHGRLHLERVLDLAIQVLEAIAAAHREGVVHRDLKPENIMVTAGGQVKVLDFGLARSVDRPASSAWSGVGTYRFDSGSWQRIDGDEENRAGDSVSEGQENEENEPTLRYPTSQEAPAKTSFLSDAGDTFGTLTYMSPEQARQEKVTPASDLYSFGIILQEMLTGARAYPKLPLLQLLDRVQKGEVLPTEGMDPRLGELIASLLDPDPEQRPSARRTAAEVRWIAGRPERQQTRQRRRRRRTAMGAALGAMALVTLGAVLLTRHDTNRQAEIGRQLSRSAGDLSWQVRTSLQAPAHDLRPGRREIRLRMDELRAEIAALGRLARGPGLVALGQTALAIGDAREARDHLEKAWRSGYRPPEAAIGLGLASFEHYRQSLSRVLRIPDEAARREQLEELRRQLRDPAVRYLEVGRAALEERGAGEITPRSRGESPAYVSALIAFYEERYGEALDQARRAVESLPWLFEAEVLLGRIHTARGLLRELEGQQPGAVADFEAAWASLHAAAEVGRSDPEAHTGICELAGLWLRLINYDHSAAAEAPGESSGEAESEDPPSGPSIFAGGERACEIAHLLDPEDADPWRLHANLLMREAESFASLERKVPLLRRAAELGRQAIELRPADTDGWRILGHVYSVEVDWLLFREGRVDAELVARMTEAYEEASRLAPTDPLAFNTLGNAYSLTAEGAQLERRDPGDAGDRSVAAYERSLELADRPFVQLNLGMALAPLARWQRSRGIDPEPTLARGHSALDRALPSQEHNPVLWSTRGLLHLEGARLGRDRGEDPRPLLDRALEA